MHSTTTTTTNTATSRSCSNARRMPLRALLLALIVMTSLQQAALAAASVPRTKSRTLEAWQECLKGANGTFQYNPNPQFDVPQGFKDQLIPQFSGTLSACGQPVMGQLYFRMMVNRSGSPAAVPARRTMGGVIVEDLTPGDYVLTVEVFLTRTTEDARALREASGDKPLPKVPLVPLNRPKIMQPFRILAVTPNVVPNTATFVRLSTLQTGQIVVSFGAAVNNAGPNKPNWTCCVTGNKDGPCSGPCPDAIRNQLGSNTSNLALKFADGKALPVGLYRVLLKMGPANATFMIGVESVAIVPVEVTQNFDPSKDAFMIFAKTAPDAVLSWKVNGVSKAPADASGRSLRVPRPDLSPSMPTEVLVTATAKDGTTGTATIQLGPMVQPVVTCDAKNAEKPGQSNVQALTDRVRLVAHVSGVPEDASKTFNFGYGRAPSSSASVGDDATPVYLTPGPILTNEFNTTAPNVPTATANNAFQVPFFVDVVVNGQIKIRGACPLVVNPPVFGTPALADVQVKEQQDVFARAVESGDNSAMINAASNAMGLALAQGTAKTDDTTRRQLENNLAGNMATALRRTIGTDGTTGARTSDMTAEVKANALDCLSQMSLAPLKAGAPPPADCNATCVAKLRTDVLDVVASAIAPGTDGTRIDMKTNAKKLLDVMANIAPGQDTTRAVRQAADVLASQTSIGETVVIASTDGKTKVAGTRIPATLVADLTSTVYERLESATGGVAMSWPSGVALPGAAAGSTVSLAATTLTTTPFPSKNGLPANVAASSSTTDFSVALDGEQQNITNMGVPIKCELSRTPFSTAAQTMVRYYDETAGAWSSAGITDVTYDAATGRVSFKTTHLTAFATFDTQTAADTPAPPVTTTAAASNTTTAAVTPATTATMSDASARTVVTLALCAAIALIVA